VPVTPGGKIAARIVGNRTIRRVLGFDLPERDVRWAGLTPGMRVLEIGSGRGLYTGALLGAVGASGFVLAVEYFEEAARILGAEFDGAKVIVGDARRLPIADGQTFDAICCFYSIEEVPDYTVALGELARLVRKGGIMVLFLWRPLCRKGKRSSIVDVLKSAGFEVEARWADIQNVRVVLRKS
jgi:ubiquinone/menaquinone biosynthesis C-methylase UbiE